MVWVFQPNLNSRCSHLKGNDAEFYLLLPQNRLYSKLNGSKAVIQNPLKNFCARTFTTLGLSSGVAHFAMVVDIFHLACAHFSCNFKDAHLAHPEKILYNWDNILRTCALKGEEQQSTPARIPSSAVCFVFRMSGGWRKLSITVFCRQRWQTSSK